MQLQQSFVVSAPVGRVWAALIDVEQVAPCLPGASITARNEDGSYEGAFAVKIGPTSASYTGKLEMEDVDEGAHRATMKANGTDKRGQGGASATIISTLTELGPDATRVEVDTDYRITGRLARFGRGGMIEDISEKLLRQFADNLQAKLAGPAEPPPAPAPAGAPVAPSTPTGAPQPTSPPETPPPTRAEPPLDLGGVLGRTLLERARRYAPAFAALALLLVLRRRRR